MKGCSQIKFNISYFFIFIINLLNKLQCNIMFITS